jgi:hypothetical protein
MSQLRRTFRFAVILLVCTGHERCRLPTCSAEAAAKVAQPSPKLIRTIDTKPFAGGRQGVTDSESLAYSPQDDAFWIADDDGDAVHQFARKNGRFLMKVTAADLVRAFAEAGRCDNGTTTPCSCTKELETVACDSATGDVYVVNTVNDPKRNPPVDKQAIYRFRKQGAVLEYESWHPLPPGIRNEFAAMIFIDGRLYVGGRKELVEYDFRKRRFTELDSEQRPVPIFRSGQGAIVGLGYEGPNLWVLTAKKKLVKVDWEKKRELAVWDLATIPGVDLGVPKGLQVVSGEAYIVDGDSPHKIFVLRVP